MPEDGGAEDGGAADGGAEDGGAADGGAADGGAADGGAADGGDEVCWLSRLCPECGAMPSRTELGGDEPERCWRCGAHGAAAPRGEGAAQPESP